MTRARALKQVIRERAAKTGERYTTARRHVLSAVARQHSTEPRRDDPPSETRAGLSKPPTTKGGLSDAKAIEKTGHGLAYWFGVLDRFGGVDKGHTALARHLFKDHKVPSWYCQGITVAYERARGVRVLNQRCDGAFEVSVSKVMAGGAADVAKAFAQARSRQRWLANADPNLVKALATAVDSPASKGFVVRPDGQGRYRYKWGSTSVQMQMLPKPNGKISVVITNAELDNAPAVEARRVQWRLVLNALAGHLNG